MCNGTLGRWRSCGGIGINKTRIRLNESALDDARGNRENEMRDDNLQQMMDEEEHQQWLADKCQQQEYQDYLDNIRADGINKQMAELISAY